MLPINAFFFSNEFLMVTLTFHMLFFVGSGWMYYFVIFIQTAINTGISIGAVLLAGECLQV